MQNTRSKPVRNFCYGFLNRGGLQHSLSKNFLYRFLGLSSLTSIYRLPKQEYHVHRPHFTGYHNGLGSQGRCGVYQSFFFNLNELFVRRWIKSKVKVRADNISNVESQLVVFIHIKTAEGGSELKPFYDRPFNFEKGKITSKQFYDWKKWKCEKIIYGLIVKHENAFN